MKQKVLIVDDETDFCLIMKGYFIKKGYEVSIAHSIKEGLTLLKKNPPDILFLDNNMPDGNGWDLIGQIVEIIPQIRAFLVSAHRNISPVKENNNITVWEKPISINNLNNIFNTTAG